MKLTLLKVILEQFKGVAHAEYTFGDRTAITGRNGSGKTTIADAALWLFADKDYSLKSNPEIHPDFLPVSEPSVTAVCDIDGKEVTFRKFQKDSRTKKQVESGVPIRISNQYEINSVPKSQKDFMAYLGECGINVETMLLLSHPEIFINQKDADCRKILFGMTSDITDKQIADSLPDCKEAAELLDSYAAEEITAMKKREKKEALENIDAIPQQIIGMEKSKVDLPVDEFNAQKESLTAEIEQMEQALADLDIPSIGDLNQKLAILDQEERQLVAKANADRIEKYNDMTTLISSLTHDAQKLENDKIRKTEELNDLIRNKSILEKAFEDYKEQFSTFKMMEFEVDTQGKCPNCGQMLPVHTIDKMKKSFDEDKANKMHGINKEAKRIQDGIENANKGIKELDAEIKQADSKLNTLREEIEKSKKNREPFEHVIDIAGSEELIAINQKRAEIKHQMARIDELKAESDEISNNIRVRKQTVREIENRLVELRVNDRIDKQIKELKQKQREYADAEASATRVLDQLQAISMAKNKALTDEVNSHFEIVRFKLFYQTKTTDEFKGCCIPTIKSEDGTYKAFGESANTALEVRGKLDIIRGLQKFYNTYLPVFVDGWECLDSNNANKIQMDTQLITLAVTDGDLKVEVL